jgi:tetratricopeptide (TPR) repeat protein
LAAADDADGAVVRLVRADSLLQVAEAIAGDWIRPTVERAEVALMMAVDLLDPDLSVTDAVSGSPTDALLEGARHAERALRREPDDPRALAIRGEILLRLWNFGDLDSKDSLLPAAYRDLTRATELDPGLARAWYTLSDVQSARGSSAQSRLAAEKALAADVYAAWAPAVITQLFNSALGRGAAMEADSLCAVGQRHYPANPNFLECRLTTLGWFGSGGDAVDEAWTIVRHLDTLSVVAASKLHRRLLVAAMLARSGLRDSTEAVLAATRALASDEAAWASVAVSEAHVWVLLGEHSRPIELLESLMEADPQNREWLVRHPWFRSLREEPEFRRLMDSETP